MFIHKSYQEYFAAQKIVNEMGFGLEGQKAKKPIPKRFNGDYALNKASLNHEPPIIYFIRDELEATPQLRDQLYAVIELSKTKPAIAQAAANAITILNAAGHSFSFQDLSKVQIPGANLANGFFDHTNFAGANLEGVNFSQAWLKGANLSNSQMQKVTFGQWPAYKGHTGDIESVAFSPRTRPMGSGC